MQMTETYTPSVVHKPSVSTPVLIDKNQAGLNLETIREFVAQNKAPKQQQSQP